MSRGGGGWTKARPAPVTAALLLAAVVLAVTAPAPAGAREGRPGFDPPPVAVPGELPPTPPDFSVPAGEAIAAASAEPDVVGLRRRHGEVEAVAEVQPGRWEVFYSAGGERRVLVLVDGRSGEVLESWTGDQVAWGMARGNEGQFGHVLNAPYVWLPLCAIFLLGLLDLRRLRRVAHLDLLVLLSFGVSHAFFNAAEIGVSVPLAYPPLLYLLARMAWIGFHGAGEGLRPSAPVAWLAIATTFLVGFRLAINVADSGVIDVGYAGVIGADRLSDGEAVYGGFPDDNAQGDTYGPLNYLAYVPFELALPWSGSWDELPAAHAAAIAFDLATILGLLVLGRRLRPGRGGRDLAVVLAFAWAAFPYTAFALQSNSNDTLVAALVVWSLVAFASPAGRAALVAAAGMVKFAPFALAPLFLAGERGAPAALRDRPPDRRRWLRGAACGAAALAGVCALLLVQPALDPGLATFWERTVASQVERESPFSIWGQASALAPLQAAVAAAAAGFAAALALVPRIRTPVQVAALAAAVLIVVQLALEHWFYLYIPWFFGAAMAAIAAPRAPAPTQAPSAGCAGPAG